MKNKQQIRKLLTIKDPKKETIYGVIGRMETLLDYFGSDEGYRGYIPFLMTYYLVTKASSEKYIQYKRYFWYMHDHEILDIYFASLYFSPLLHFLETGKVKSPWQQYFGYCRKTDGIPFLQMLLGINAHINADLYMAIAKLHYKHQHDFFIVNDILLEVVPTVMRFLASKHDIIGTGGVVLKDFIITEFHMVVERWRSEAWANALLTNRANKDYMSRMILHNTERIGSTLIQDFQDIYAMRNVKQAAAMINMLSVHSA